jgi:hypothetical protein
MNNSTHVDASSVIVKENDVAGFGFSKLSCLFYLEGEDTYSSLELEEYFEIIVEFCWFFSFVSLLFVLVYDILNFVCVYPLYIWDDFYFNLIFIFSFKKNSSKD